MAKKNPFKPLSAINSPTLTYLDSYMAKATYADSKTRTAFIKDWLVGERNLAKKHGVSKTTVANWKKLLRTAMQDPDCPANAPQDEAITTDPEAAEEFRQTINERLAAGNHIGQEEFRRMLDEMLRSAFEDENHRAFGQHSKTKLEVEPGLKLPDYNININLEFLGTGGLDNIDKLMVSRLAKLGEFRDELSPELLELLPAPLSPPEEVSESE